MVRLRCSTLVAIAIMATVSTSSLAGPAINQFEVKDLRSEAGAFEFQSQNAWSTGQPARRATRDAPGEFVYDENSVARQREALEIQVGISDYFRVCVGIEYEQQRLDEPGIFEDRNAFGDLQLDELALEGVLVFVKPSPEGVGLGLLVEYGAPLSGGREEQSEVFIGPILEAHTGPWSLIANLAFVRHMGGEADAGDDAFVRDEKWDFAYFLQSQYEFSDAWALALEAYGTFDRIGDSGTRNEAAELFGDFDQHRAGPVVYYTFKARDRSRAGPPAPKLSDDNDRGEKDVEVSIGAGALFGLNENTPDTTYKLSLEVEF